MWLAGILVFGIFTPPAGMAAPSSAVTLSPDTDGVQRVTIIMDSYSFSPDTLVIQAGKPVSIQLENHSFLTPHNFIIDNPAMGLHHEIEVGSGDAVNLQLLFTTPGTYTFYCDKQLLFFPSHREEGMEGHLEVR